MKEMSHLGPMTNHKALPIRRPQEKKKKAINLSNSIEKSRGKRKHVLHTWPGKMSTCQRRWSIFPTADRRGKHLKQTEAKKKRS